MSEKFYPQPPTVEKERRMESSVKLGAYQHWKLDYPADAEHAEDGETRGLYQVLHVINFDRNVDRENEKIVSNGNFSGVIKDIPNIGKVELIDVPEEYMGNLVVFGSLSGKPHFENEGVVALARTEDNWGESGKGKREVDGKMKEVTFENRFRPVDPNDAELIQKCEKRAKELYILT